MIKIEGNVPSPVTVDIEGTEYIIHWADALKTRFRTSKQLRTASERISADIISIGVLLADATRWKSEQELYAKDAYSAVFKIIKKGGNTDKHAEAEARSDSNYIEHKEELLAAQHSVDTLTYIMNALEHRARLVRSLMYQKPNS